MNISNKSNVVYTCNGDNLTCNFQLDSSSEDSSGFSSFLLGTAIFIAVIALFTIVANTLLLLVFYLDPLKTFRNPMSYFLMCLALSDFLTAVLHEPLMLSCLVLVALKGQPEWRRSKNLLNIGWQIYGLTSKVSLCTVMALTGTQYMAVSHPLKIKSWVTKTRVSALLIGINIYAGAWFTAHELVSAESLIIADIVVHGLGFQCTILVLYFLLEFAVRKSLRRSNTLREQSRSNTATNSLRQRLLQKKFVSLNALLIIVLIVCHFPFVTLTVVYFCKGHALRKNTDFTMTIMIVKNLKYLKIFLDAFVYAWRLPTYRQALKNVLFCQTVRSSQVMRGMVEGASRKKSSH